MAYNFSRVLKLKGVKGLMAHLALARAEGTLNALYAALYALIWRYISPWQGYRHIRAPALAV